MMLFNISSLLFLFFCKFQYLTISYQEEFKPQDQVHTVQRTMYKAVDLNIVYMEDHKVKCLENLLDQHRDQIHIEFQIV